MPWFTARNANHYKGIKIGELQLTPHISLDIGYNNANNMSKGMYGTVKYTLGTSKFAFWVASIVMIRLLQFTLKC